MATVIPISKDLLEAVINGEPIESDYYRIAYGTAFMNMNSRVMSLAHAARKSLSLAYVDASRVFIAQAYNCIDCYEHSPLFIEGKTEGVRRHIGRIENRL